MRITPPAMTMAGGVFRCFVRRALPLRGERVFFVWAIAGRAAGGAALSVPWPCRGPAVGLPRRVRPDYYLQQDVPRPRGRPIGGSAETGQGQHCSRACHGSLPQGRSGPVQAGCGRYQPGGHGVLGRQRTGQNGVAVRAEAGRRFLPLQGRQGREKGSLWGILQ